MSATAAAAAGEGRPQYGGDMMPCPFTTPSRDTQSLSIWPHPVTQTGTNFMPHCSVRFTATQSSCLDPTICLYVVCMHICTRSQIFTKLGTKKHENAPKNTHTEQLCVAVNLPEPSGSQMHKVGLFYAVLVSITQSCLLSRRSSSSSRDRLSYAHTNNIQTNCGVVNPTTQSCFSFMQYCSVLRRGGGSLHVIPRMMKGAACGGW